MYRIFEELAGVDARRRIQERGPLERREAQGIGQGHLGKACQLLRGMGIRGFELASAQLVGEANEADQARAGAQRQ